MKRKDGYLCVSIEILAVCIDAAKEMTEHAICHEGDLLSGFFASGDDDTVELEVTVIFTVICEVDLLQHKRYSCVEGIGIFFEDVLDLAHSISS
jgi:hypothetical protein